MIEQSGVTVRVVEGGWRGTLIEDVKTLVDEVIAAFGDAPYDGMPTKVAIERIFDGPPRACSNKNGDEFRVLLNSDGTHRAQMAFQFSHEFCHVLADSTTWIQDEFAWIEEALAESASMFALRKMAAATRNVQLYPPNPLDVYAEECCIAIGKKLLPLDADISPWLAERLPCLRKDLCLRNEHKAIAVQFLPIFERNPCAWRVLRSLHAFGRADISELPDFLRKWLSFCSAEDRKFVSQIATALGIYDVSNQP